MSIRIDVLDPGSERDLADAATIGTAYWREVLGPEESAETTDEVVDGLHVGRPDIDATALLARDGDRTVGLATIDIRTGQGNEHMAWVEDLYVVVDARRRGTGTALLAELTSRARAAGRSLVLGGYHDGSVDGAGFAANVGAEPGQAERQNRVRVADLDRPMLEQWVADAAASATGYSLVAFDGPCPDDLVDDVVRLAAVMNDAPRTEALDDFVHTVAHRRADEAEMARIGTGSWYAGARHDASGELAGFTEMVFRPYKPWLAEQGDTGVAPAHRGHGIGRWLKAVNALRVLDERADAEIIETWNDGTNRWMLAINDAMGFRPVATWIEAELELC